MCVAHVLVCGLCVYVPCLVCLLKAKKKGVKVNECVSLVLVPLVSFFSPPSLLHPHVCFQLGPDCAKKLLV